MRKSLWIILAVMIVAVGAPNAQADTTSDLNLPGISNISQPPGPGDLIPIESYMINPTDLIVTRQVDSFSPELFDATVLGHLFATGSVETFDSSFSTKIPFIRFVMTDILITSIQHSGSNENPVETLTLAFETGKIVSNVPEPSSLMLLGSGLLSLAGIKRRRNGC